MLRLFIRQSSDIFTTEDTLLLSRLSSLIPIELQDNDDIIIMKCGNLRITIFRTEGSLQERFNPFADNCRDMMNVLFEGAHDPGYSMVIVVDNDDRRVIYHDIHTNCKTTYTFKRLQDNWYRADITQIPTSSGYHNHAMKIDVIKIRDTVINVVQSSLHNRVHVHSITKEDPEGYCCLDANFIPHVLLRSLYSEEMQEAIGMIVSKQD